LQLASLKIGEKGVVTAIKLKQTAKKKLLTFGIGLGSIIIMDYSPGFTSLCNITINGKSISIRKTDAHFIEVVKYQG
jgi:Fe2+ transport system protein FeoA